MDEQARKAAEQGLKKRLYAQLLPITRVGAESLAVSLIEPNGYYPVENMLVVRATYDFWEEQLETREKLWPATWWQHVKERFFPRWLLRRFPVRYDQYVVNTVALYPHLSFPDQAHVHKIRVEHRP